MNFLNNVCIKKYNHRRKFQTNLKQIIMILSFFFGFHFHRHCLFEICFAPSEINHCTFPAGLDTGQLNAITDFSFLSKNKSCLVLGSSLAKGKIISHVECYRFYKNISENGSNLIIITMMIIIIIFFTIIIQKFFLNV